MVFSDTTNLNGIVNRAEYYTNLGNTTISGNAILLKQFTVLANEALNDLLPLVLSRTDDIRWDDPQQTTFPFGLADIISGTNYLNYTADSLGNSVYNISKVFIKSSTTTDFNELKRVFIGEDMYAKILNPSTTNDVGIPAYFTEFNGTIFTYPIPNYNLSNGVKIFFERQPIRFISSGSTTTGAIPFANVTPGIPDIFHELIPMKMSRNWLTINKPENTILIQSLNADIQRKEMYLEAYQNKRSPQKSNVKGLYVSTR